MVTCNNSLYKGEIKIYYRKLLCENDNLVQSFSKGTWPSLTIRSCVQRIQRTNGPLSDRWWLISGVKSSDGSIARLLQGCMAGLASLPAGMRGVCRPWRRILPLHQKSRTWGEWMYPVQPHESAVCMFSASLSPVFGRLRLAGAPVMSEHWG